MDPMTVNPIESAVQSIIAQLTAHGIKPRGMERLRREVTEIYLSSPGDISIDEMVNLWLKIENNWNRL